MALKQLDRVAPKDIFPLGGGDWQLLNDLFRAWKKRQKRRRIAAKKQPLCAHSLVGAHHGRRVIGHRIHIEPTQVIAGTFGDEQRLVRSQAGGLVAERISIIHTADDFADPAAEMAADEFYAGKSLEDPAHDHT